MEALPHFYKVSSLSIDDGAVVTLSGEGLPDLTSVPPKQFGGPGGEWSPEDLFVAAIADCFILTFKSIARGKKLEWTNIQCSVTGVLDRLEKITQFTKIEISPAVQIAEGQKELAERVLQQAEKSCLITNSLKCAVELKDISLVFS